MDAQPQKQLTLTNVGYLIEKCDAKKVYPTYGKALISAAYHPKPMRPYQCLVCGLWHLSSKPKRC